MIYCIGDSFTYGDELKDPTKSAWPIILGNLLNKTAVNLGKNGSGNTRIVKRTIDAAFCDDAELIIVAWTGPHRVEFFNEGPCDIWPGKEVWTNIKDQITIAKAMTNATNDKFDLYLYRKWLRDVILAQNLLQNLDKTYLMAVAWHSWGPIPGSEDLWNKINWNNFLGHPSVSKNPDYETFNYWIVGSPIGKTRHPLELGHQKIAEKFYEHIRNLSWFS
jgi:hypothetical protein